MPCLRWPIVELTFVLKLKIDTTCCRRHSFAVFLSQGVQSIRPQQRFGTFCFKMPHVSGVSWTEVNGIEIFLAST